MPDLGGGYSGRKSEDELTKYIGATLREAVTENFPNGDRPSIIAEPGT